MNAGMHSEIGRAEMAAPGPKRNANLENYPFGDGVYIVILLKTAVRV